MVGFVIVSHSKNLAESVVELTTMMAPGCQDQTGGRHGRRQFRNQF